MDEPELPPRPIDPLRVFPGHSEVLVREDRDLRTVVGRGEDAANLLPEVAARVEPLALGVDGVVAVLSDGEDAVHRDLRPAQAARATRTPARVR